MALGENRLRLSNVAQQVMMFVGRIYLAKGCVDDCRVMFERAVNSAKTQWGEEHPITKDCVSDHMALVQDMSQLNLEDLVRKWFPQT